MKTSQRHIKTLTRGGLHLGPPVSADVFETMTGVGYALVQMTDGCHFGCKSVAFALLNPDS